MTLRTKFRLMIGLAGCMLLVVSLTWVFSERSKLLTEKQEKVRNLVDLAYSVVLHYSQMEKDGTLSVEEAQRRSLDAIRAMRYADGNYLWINDMHPTMIMHPLRPDLDGKDLSDYRDPTGKALFVQMVATVKSRGSGYVNYMWPKPGKGNAPVPKTSYVRAFDPWGWVIGTGIYVDDVDADWRANALEAGLITLFSMAILFLVSGIVSRSIFRRLAEITHRIDDVTRGEGDLTQRIRVSSTDEVAEVARGFNAFVEKIEGTIARVAENAQQVAAASEEFSATSQQITANSEETTAQANTVSAATEEVSRSLQTVATGAEEMSATIKDIAKNASESARVAADAVKTAQTTNAIVSKLGDSSAEIGQVVKVITSIAQQTNLLALNATIEAARAGEAGKGFAVVANEVKELSKQTAKATEDISRKITAIQEDTKSAVEAISAISGVIDKISDISSTIAAAVEEQSATTNEMTRNVTEAAKGSGAISETISGVAQAAQSTSSSAHQTQKAAADLSQMSTHLRRLVDQFKVQANGHRQGGSPDAQPAG